LKIAVELVPIFLSALAASATAQTPPLQAQGAWIRALPGADVAAAYLTLRNLTANAVTITGVQSPVAVHAVIHETALQDGQSRMRPHESLVIAAGQTIKLESGGLHVMLQGLAQPLTVGQRVPLTLSLAGGGALRITAVVRPLHAE
jgi:periplasmic copper chaperone A